MAPELNDEETAVPDALTPGEYARRVEVYLCRKNDGHLIRIVGPAFEQVCRWAGSGIPLKVAFCGIDRYFERYHSKGPRRWPVRIEFCENDVLDVFDDWRRAVGVGATSQAADGSAEGQAEAAASHRSHSLPRHLERVALRLSSVLAGTTVPGALRDQLDAIAREVDALMPSSRGLRGPARQAVVARLAELDEALSAAIRAVLTAPERVNYEAEADRELLPFRHRLPDEAAATAREALVVRLARDGLGIPIIRLE